MCSHDFSPNHLALWSCWFFSFSKIKKRSAHLWPEATESEVHMMISGHPQHSRRTSIRQLLLHCTASSLSAKSAYVNNCPKCGMRPLAARLCSAKWMYFTPFELRKVWSFSDVNWTPLSLSSSFGIPYPVNNLLVWTGENFIIDCGHFQEVTVLMTVLRV